MIKFGIENIERYMDLFNGKKIGLITNPTGVNDDFQTTIDILNEKTQLVALFSPEHGVRGDLQAGVKLDPYVDPSTQCMVYSLYGDTKKPTGKMLEQIDVIAFDIQDVGARFYTYIYTMAYAMMAAKEHGKTFVVFDRPNPLNGIDVEGTILDLNFRSFVGYYPLTQRYGLTIGELALLFNDHFEIGCDLKVIPMEGYQRSMDYAATGKHWVLPSPNIPTPESVYTYMATCLFEGTNVSEGRGTTKPFSIIGAPWLDAKQLIEKLKSHGLEGVTWRAMHFTPVFSKHKDMLCQGVELYVTDKHKFKPVLTGLTMLLTIKAMHPEFKYLDPYKEGLNPMISLLTGDDYLIKDRLTIEELKEKLIKDAETFTALKERYHLYDI